MIDLLALHHPMSQQNPEWRCLPSSAQRLARGRGALHSWGRQQPRLQATQPLEVSQLSEDQKATASHMCALGILKPAEHRSELFLCPTFLAGLLCGTGAAPTAANASIAGFIVVETSFRVYAYTSSPVQVLPSCLASGVAPAQSLARESRR